MGELDTDIIFYIAHHRTNEQIARLLTYSIQSIRQHYPDSTIVVCDSTPEYTQYIYDISNIVWTENPIINSACIGCYKDYLQRYKNTNKKVVFMHDTMVLKSRFIEERLARSFGFIWKFEDVIEKQNIHNSLIKKDMYIMLDNYNMDHDSYVGCFGWAVYGTYESIETLWNSISLEIYMKYDNRNKVMLDLERVIGITAFCKGLVNLSEDYSLCDDIFQHPYAFNNTFKLHSYDDIQNFSYEHACVKFWGNRTYTL